MTLKTRLQNRACILACRIDPATRRPNLAADNAELVVIEVVERVPVLLVEGADGYAELQQDAFFCRPLGQIEGGEIEGSQSADWRAVFEPRSGAFGIDRPQRLGLSLFPT